MIYIEILVSNTTALFKIIDWSQKSSGFVHEFLGEAILARAGSFKILPLRVAARVSISNYPVRIEMNSGNRC